MSKTLTELGAELEKDQEKLERELTEIDLLMHQASSEAERHETRRAQAGERLAALEKEPRADPTALAEARAQLLSQTRRQTMMQGQVEVLQGKQRALQRFHERLGQILPVLREGRGAADSGLTVVGNGRAGEGAGTTANAHATSRDVMAAQEAMRREIARQMHDGPAQSIANIALQAQVVQRIITHDPRQAEAELRALVGMVQGALEATKNFIFDIRPMVLDDLGLVPTLRRSAAQRSRLSAQTVRFESVGADGRLPSELESGIFRIVDDAVQGLLEARPSDLVVRLDWLENAVKATVRGRPSGKSDAPADVARAAVAAARRDKQMPAALATMIHEQESSDSRGLAPKVWAEIRDRAEPVGIDVTLSEDGWVLEASVSHHR